MESIKIKTPLGNYIASASCHKLISFLPEEFHVAKLPRSFNESNDKSLENIHIFKSLEDQLNEYFLKQRKSFELPLDLRGTHFQKKVWNELISIEYGTLLDYQALASSVGNSKACRAVGSANGKNPMHIIIPCHRIIRKDGSLGGYKGGVKRKQYLISLEATEATS